MSEPLPWLIEKSIAIAWDYLRRSGELGEVRHAGQFLLKVVDEMVMNGERRKLMLANRAIDAYRRQKHELNDGKTNSGTTRRA